MHTYMCIYGMKTERGGRDYGDIVVGSRGRYAQGTVMYTGKYI